MKTPIRIAIVSAALLECAIPLLRGQVVADGATRTMINETNSFSGDVIIGTNGTFTLLTLSTNALLTNSVSGIIGLNSTAHDNEVRLISNTSRWLMGGNLFVGSNGALNRLVISNGALVRAGAAYVGFYSFANNNLALITGAGSLWDPGVLYLGYLGTGNQLVVSNGGSLHSALAYLGADVNSSNQAGITGSGSVWTNDLEMGIGLGGAGNQLLVSNGGVVRNGRAFVGVNATASNNLALITGSSSLWSNTLDLNIGYFGSKNNQMVVSNGATVFAAGNGIIGQTTNANGNSVTVTDSGTSWLVGNDIYVGSNGALNQLVIGNGALLNNNRGFVGNNAFSISNRVVVMGAGSSWRNNNLLVIGENGGGNSLEISDGAFVADSDAAVGDISSGNQALITGANSIWSNRFELTVGYLRGANQMLIGNGALVRSGSGYVGRGTGGTNCQAFITGAGSHWTNETGFYVGVSGTDNRVTVENGGVLSDGTAILGANFSATNNEVVVGSGGFWNNVLDLILGQSGNANRLVVTNGGLVSCAIGRIGQQAISVRNEASVTGFGSVWSNRSDLYVGELGSGNRLVVSNGGVVSVAGQAVMGINPGAISNSVTVAGPGSSWMVASNMYLGSNGAFNLLVVSNGGRVMGSMNGVVGNNSSSSNNAVLVTGPNSLWSNFFNVNIGLFGGSNRLVVEKGGRVISDATYIGALSSQNEAVLTDAGSVWTNVNELVVGDSGAFNRLVVTNGGVVQDTDGAVGFSNPAGSNNLALVTGSGSMWSNAASLSIGRFGSGNLLVVTNGGTVSASNLYVSASSVATKNRSVVDGGTLRAVTAATNGTFDIQRGTNVLNAGLVNVDQLVLTNRLVSEGPTRFGNGGSISIPTGGPATPYPSTISVSGFLGTITKVTVTLSNLSHAFPADLDILLVSPSGQKVMLMSDAGSSNDLSNVRLTFDDAGPFLPFTGTIAAGTYRPTDYVGGDTLPSPAPPRPYSTDLSSFNGSSPNGTWSLYVNDAFNPDGGSLVGWGLQIGADVSPGVFEFNGGTLMTRGAVISNALPFVVGTSGTNPAIWDARAGLINTFVSSDIWIGRDASLNQLFVTNGTVLTNLGYGRIGKNGAARTNSVTIAGSGSQWLLDGGVIVGDFGSANRFVVSNGAKVVAGSYAVLGYDHFSSNNEAVVTGPGSTWVNNLGELVVGSGGPGNRLTVGDGGQLASFSGRIGGNYSDTSNNLALVTGAGSSWSNAFALRVGDVGAANRLVVSNGGAVIVTGQGFIGDNSGANSAIVTDAGTRWLVTSNLYVGNNGVGNQLVIANGGRLEDFKGLLGWTSSSIGNVALVTGTGSVWSNSNALVVGQDGPFNRLVVSNGGLVQSSIAQIGNFLSSSNEVVVTDPGSVWSPVIFELGNGAGANRMLVTNGGFVNSPFSYFGFQSPSKDNEAVVTGPDSRWNCGEFQLGYSGSGNRLVVTNASVVFSSSFCILGANASSTNNRLTVAGGTLKVTNAPTTAVLDVRRGTNVLNAGLEEVDQLLLTNTLGRLEFNGGTLSVKKSTAVNGQFFNVGNGSSPATLNLAGNGLHDFSGVLGLAVSSNAVITGNGTLKGALSVLSGGKLIPGTSVGKIVLSNSPSLQGATIMEISKNGATLTNDQIQVTVPLTYGGSLIVTNIGPTALVAGNGFQLFSAPSYSGSFSAISLPPLGPGLTWTNKLLVEGSIQVAGAAQPVFAGITLSGTNLIITGTNGTAGASYAVLTTTNITIPSSNWLSIFTNNFGSGGEFSFTNSMLPGEQQRYFRIRTP